MLRWKLAVVGVVLAGAALGSLLLGGRERSEAQSLPTGTALQAGFSNVAYLGASGSVRDRLGDAADSVTAIWSFRHGATPRLLWSPSRPDALQGFPELEFGAAYFVVADGSAQWTFVEPDVEIPGNVDLRQGLNHIVYFGDSLPVQEVLGSFQATGLRGQQTGASCVRLIWSFDGAWRLWNPSLPPLLLGLTALSQYAAYFIDVTEPCRLSFPGVVPGAATEIARTLIVNSGESIQDAVDAASPGDRILVQPGLYTGTPGDDAVVEVRTDDLTLRGLPGAVIEARGFRYGIMVGEDAPISAAGCPPITVQGFTIEGFTVRNATDSGLLLVGVDDYSITDGRYIDNDEYGPFPVCSTNGYIARNFASGHKDAAIYVGVDDGVVIEHNTVTQSAIGIELENATNVVVRHNTLTGNTAGIVLVVLPGLPIPVTQNVLIESNTIVGNNLPRPPTGGLVRLPPVGTGILNVGGDRVVIENNTIRDNDSFGVLLMGNPFAFRDRRIEPFVDGNEVRENIVVDNGAGPDPNVTFAAAADISFIPHVVDLGSGMVLQTDADSSDNCFDQNTFDVDFPVGIVGLFPCP